MAERTKLLYIIVHDEESNGGEVTKETLTSSFRYTRPVLQSTLQLFGCKQRHGFKISKRVFSLLENNYRTTSSGKKQDNSSCISGSYSQGINVSHFETNKVLEGSMISMDGELKEGLFGNTYSSTIVLGRDVFLDLVSDALSEYRYMGPSQRADLLLACRVRERKTSMTVLLCGTSGCGKSTLSSLLASRLGITTVVSTDSIRHMMRSFVDEKENPLLWASTYHAGEFLDPAAVAEAKARKIKKKMEGFPARIVVDDCSKFSQGIPLVDALSKDFNLREVEGGGILLNETNSEEPETFIKPKTMVVQGYKAQSEMVIDSLDRLITAWEQKCESVVVEGVHLSINFVMGLMKKHPSVIPFMIYIVNEEKHLERFAVRAKYMTLDPAKNKYVKYIRNIRTIQDYLCARADKYLVPKVNNTNVDRSIASIHATIFGCLRRRGRGEPFYDQTTNTVKVIDEEYRSQCVANSLGSKGMLQLIKRRGYSRQLLALVNTDGSVAQAWSFDSGGNVQASTMSGNIHSINSSVFEHLVVEKSEPVNLQFGNFGLSAWEPDLGGTSHNGSIDGLSTKGGLSENDGSRFDSSCSSTPRHVDGAEKELINENALSGSDEEPEEVPDAETDDDFDFDFKSKPFEEHELEGSVDDQSLRSDEDDDDEFVAVDEQDEYCSMDLEGGIELGGEISGRTQESQARLLVNTTRSKSVDSNGDLQKEDDQLSAYAVHEKQVKFLKVNSLVQLV